MSVPGHHIELAYPHMSNITRGTSCQFAILLKENPSQDMNVVKEINCLERGLPVNNCTFTCKRAYTSGMLSISPSGSRMTPWFKSGAEPTGQITKLKQPLLKILAT